MIASPVTLSDGRTDFDPVRMNSVDVVSGDLIVSLRQTDAVYRIQPGPPVPSVEAGRHSPPERLTVNSDPYGGLFGGQHGARILGDGSITIHDNGSGRGRAPRAARFQIDTVAKTATLVDSRSDPDIPGSFCCGSARSLPGGSG